MEGEAEVKQALDEAEVDLMKMSIEELTQEVMKLNEAHEQYINQLTRVGKRDVHFGLSLKRALETNRALAALCIYLLELKK